MTESLCSCCKLLGKPPARVNFIIATGLPDSLVYQRIKYLLKNYSESSSSANDTRLTNYDMLMDISDELFTRHNSPESIDQALLAKTQACCHGFTTMPIDADDISDASHLETFRKDIHDLLDPKGDLKTEDENTKSESESWIILLGSTCLEPALLNVFLGLQNQNSLLLSFTLTVICFLVDEQRLFENWLFHNLSIQDYQKNTYPEYERRIRSFFSLLNSSKYLQKNTLLIKEQIVLTDTELQTFVQNLFRNESSKYRATNDKLRRDMEKLLSFRQRTVRDVRSVRNTLQKCYHQITQDRLKPLLYDLQQTNTVANAARQIVNIVLNDFGRMNEEELRVYKRQLVLGFQSRDTQHSNTIAAQLVHYALQLLRENNDTSTPLIYSIVLVICTLATHFFFRHELFNNTPEIYTLSLLLVSQRQYALTLSGLRLCTTILNGDQNEHKYAIAYLKHDPLVARKILDAIKWLLSPYLKLKNLWKEEKEKEKDASESIEEESTVHIAERYCIRHAGNLLERSYIRSIASLFYGSADHCAQVTEDDMRNIAEVIHVLADIRMTRWIRGENKFRLSVMLISHLCAFLTPILQYSLPSVSLALLNEKHLLMTVPKAIRDLLKTDDIDEDTTNTCVRFYARLVQLKCKQQEFDDDSDDDSVDDSEDEKQKDPPTSSITPLTLNTSDSLNLSKDLISSYFDLHGQIQKTSLLYEKSTQHEQINTLFNQQWKKLDVLQLQHDHQQLQHEYTSLKEELSQMRNELQRTQSERDQFRKENIRIAQEIDNLKLIPTASIPVQSQSSSIPVSTLNNNQKSIIDELQSLSSKEITSEQAEECIREIHHRRTTFNDHDMRKSICGSLKHLGSDLYSSSVHFLHELIQNAEDNFYDDTIVPCLRIELNHSYILLSNNEQGLRARDVLALCSLAVSTKTIQHIGEKGVGFKSVFAASNQPMMISHAWRFGFHVPGVDAMSYITPLWIKDQDIPHCISNQILTNTQDTHLYLPLKFQAHTSEADLFLNQVVKAADPCILLNMRHLKKLDIIDKRKDKLTIIEKQLIGSTKLEEQLSVTFEDFTFVNLSGSIIRLYTSSEYNTFRVYTCYIDVPNSIEQRRSPRTRLIMAFPCENDYCLTSTVYTGLPVCDLGFNFLFNADFHLVTSRENVRENVPLNTFIRDHLSALFVYLLLNDLDLRKDINRYCPSSNTHQIKHSSWWLVMIDRINELITKYLSIIFDIRTGKTIRHFNKDLASLVSNEQLYNCGDIQVINSDDGFLTSERLKSFQIQSVSIMDVLHCFPDQQETTNEFRQQFRLWTQKQDEQWWSQLFHHINQTMTSEISDKILQKPLFLLQNHHQRQYLPTNNNIRLLLFITDDPSFQMWKRQLTLLQYSSTSERAALLKSNHIQLLSEERMIEIIRQDHLQLSVSSLVTNTDVKLIEEVWNDLFYLKSRLDKLNKSTAHFLVPIIGTTTYDLIQNAILPTILGIDIRPFMYPTTSPIIRLPYYNSHHYQLVDILQWEHFLLEMNCQRPSIYLPLDYTITKLPLLPTFTMFIDEKYARLGELILSAQTETTKDCLRQFPIVDNSKVEQQISPVSATFDEIIVRDLSSLPRITIPSHCRALAIDLGVCVKYDLRTCVTILQMLSNEKNTDVNLYIQWLGHLQLYVRQQCDEFNLEDLLSSCHLYLPDEKEFYSLKHLLVVSNNDEHPRGILLVSKYLKLQLISPLVNQIYWQFKDLFRLLGCTCAISIDHIYRTIYLASSDKTNFFALGDCLTTLTENGMETMIILFQYLEDLIVKCVKKDNQNIDLYKAIIENKHGKAPFGSREDLEWRFGFTCNSLSRQLGQVTGIQSQQERIGLLTIERQLIRKETDNIIYACLESKIIQNLSKDIGKRYYILPEIARTCPLVLAVFEIDYVERRGKIEWIHNNHNLEYVLNQLTDIFRHNLNDSELEVITAKYASVTLLLSDSFIIDSIDEQNEDQINRYMVDSDYPFWIFGKTILLCTGNENRDSSKAIVATSALATLLHKRKYIPFDEAKSIARQKISSCTAFRSEHIARVASGESTIYSYSELLFPTDHNSIESMIISIGQYCITEQDLEDNNSTAVAADRTALDRIYRNRVQSQNHISENETNANNWINPSIVDGIEQVTIGRNAEHFFFTYLQKCYGTVDVTPTQNWRSSSRLVNHPECRRNIDDSAGYDFELHDTREIFVRGTGSTTNRCYFEVKGTSGLFSKAHTRFHISQNELRMCRDIANNERRREREAYFIVIIQNCLDAERISFGTTIHWSENLEKVQGIPDSYQCRVVSLPPNNFSNSRIEEPRDYNHWQQPPQQHQQPMRSDGRNNNTTTQSVPANSGNSASSQSNPQHRQQPPQQLMRSDGKNNNTTTQSVPANSGNSAFGQYNPAHWQQPPQQLMRLDGRNNNTMTQSVPANSGNSASGQSNPPHRQQPPQQHPQPMRPDGRNNNTTTQSVSANSVSSASSESNPPHRQQPPQQPIRSDGRNNNTMTQSVPTNSGNPASSQSNPPHRQQPPQQHPQPMRPDGRNNNTTTQSVPANSGISVSSQSNPPHQQNQQQRGRGRPWRRDNNKEHY